MATAKFLSRDNLTKWLTAQGETRRVLAPVQEGDSTIFRPFTMDCSLCLNGLSTVSPKSSVFPPSETLMAYQTTKDEENPGKTSLDVRETLHAQPTLLFGARPCDVRGLEVIDRVFASPDHPDKYYTARRDATIVAALACDAPAPTCFCNWTGGDPASADGADLLFTPIKTGYLVEAFTPSGEQLLEDPIFEKAGTDVFNEAEQVQESAREQLPEGPSLEGVPSRITEIFDDAGFWTELSDKCLSCGVCTYVCPTCYCFNITDEQKGLSGARIRSWDNCMSALFTLEGSGHNPRVNKSQRYRNRIGHKFSYYPEAHDGALACVGCGRCIQSCPVSMDVRDVVKAVLAHEPATAEEAAND